MRGGDPEPSREAGGSARGDCQALVICFVFLLCREYQNKRQCKIRLALPQKNSIAELCCFLIKRQRMHCFIRAKPALSEHASKKRPRTRAGALRAREHIVRTNSFCILIALLLFSFLVHHLSCQVIHLLLFSTTNPLCIFF